MSLNCPVCNVWTRVLDTRTDKKNNVYKRRYECANGHRFATLETITGLKESKDELLRRVR